MIQRSFILSLLLAISVFAQSTPLLSVLSTSAGDYYVEVSARMSLDGVIYVYPLPIEVTVAPDDSTIVTYGFSANATAGVAVTIYAEELQASASYNLYVSGRSLDGSVSSPSRIIRVVTTTAPTPPTLTILGNVPSTESIVLKYSLTSSGTIWCRAYTEEEREYATVEGVYSSIQGSPVVAHVVSNYYIGNLEPNMDYYTFCVAENSRQIPMNTTFASTERHVITLAEPPYISYLGNTVTYHSISLSAVSNVRADVFNYTVVRTPDYSYPSIQLIQSGTPTRVPRRETFVLQWNNLQNATEYAISLYSQDTKGVATEQNVTSTTFFIETDIVRCEGEDGWPTTAAGENALMSCELGFSGNYVRTCGYDAHWSAIRNECVRNMCPASGVWNLTQSLTELSLPCGAGFIGMMSRFCNADGEWESADRSQCEQIYCPSDDSWPQTPALTTAHISCGVGFFGEQTRFCSATGEWEMPSSSSCVPKQLCPAEGGWEAVYEGDTYTLACEPGYAGSVSRLCALGGVWTDPIDNCTRIMCPENGIWSETPSNTTALYACPLGETGFITRFCTLDGVWLATNTSACQQIYCPAEGVWEMTLAGLTIPGPCRSGQFGQSFRTCQITGIWSTIDFSDCYDMGCLADGEWNESPIRTTLRRKCPLGYSGYQYRYCNEVGSWGEIDSTDCERIMCPAVSGFNETSSGTSVTVPCGEHFHGNMSGFCSWYGAWTDVDVSACIAIPTCPEDGVWPRTNVDSVRVLSCGVGIVGTRTRYCGADGVWGQADESACQQLYCSADGDWPQTTAGVTAFKPCPDNQFGFIRRPCSVTGEWGNVISDYCYSVWCASYEGWPATAGGFTVTLPCSSGYRGNQTRTCTGDGYWSEVDDSRCEVATCLADGVWPETAPSTSRVEAPCGIGYSGTMYRDCSVNGEWLEVDDSLCIRKRCLPSGDWPLTLSLTNVSMACPAGYTGSIDRYCGDGVWEDPVFNCDLLMCPEEDGWIGAAGTVVTRDCGIGYRGTRTRRCSMQGIWDPADESNCEEIRCPAFDVWEEARATEVQVHPCASGGFAIMTCGLDGEWEGNPTMCYTTFCPLDSQWPITAPGTTRYGSCPLGYEGQASRYCSASGTWAEVNLSQCYRLTCASEDMWPETPRGEQATISCPSHMTGTQVRTCQVDSTWGPVDQSGCVAHSCPSEDVWPQTPIGSQITLACGVGMRGYKTRVCGAYGVWEEVNDNSCSQIVCYQDGSWPTTNALETAHKECPEGLIGSIDRYCLPIGLWEDPVDNCHEPMCDADGDWPATAINTKATRICPIGYSGMYSRMCTEEQVWLEPDMSTCTRLHCTGEGMWPTTNTLTNATQPCGGDLLGEVTRYCAEDQTWDAPDISGCHPNYCVAEDDWPNTVRNRTVSIECPPGYRGLRYRTCSDDAYWSEEDRSDCRILPQHSSLVVTPNTYYLAVRIVLNVDSTFHLLPRLATTTPPSKSQMLASPFNSTCHANQTCLVIVSGLRPLTQYDVYYWYKSLEGVEPLTSVGSMYLRTVTLDIIPFELMIEDIQGDYNVIHVQVSMEMRGGYVWCRETPVPITPSRDWMKLSEPLHLMDGELRGLELVPNLLPSSQYYVYCYSEDDYGDASTLSIEDSMHIVSTLAEPPTWNTTIESTHVNSTVHINSNRNGTLCCVWRTDSIVPSGSEIESNGVCDMITENGSVGTSIEDDTNYSVYCLFKTTTLLSLISSEAHSIHTPARAPVLTHLSTAVTYQSILLSFIADRPSYLWCIAKDADSPLIPTVPEIKTAPRVTAIRDDATEVLITDLEVETAYHVFCWAESFEGLATPTPSEDLVFAANTTSLPPTLTVHSFFLSYDAIHLTIAVTSVASVQCLVVSPEAEVPSLVAFAEVESVLIDQLGEVSITGLTENTQYAAYCLARDNHRQPMLNTIASTRTLFTTPFNRHSLYVDLLLMRELTATLSILSSDSATAWCTALHTNDLPPLAATLKSTGISLTLESGVPKPLVLSNLEPDYPYVAYCYSESSRGIAQENPISATRTNFTTMDYPRLMVAMSPVSSNPSYSVELDVTVSTSATLYCRPRVVQENELPPSNDWILEGQTLTILQPHITNFMTISGLSPATFYHVFCTAISAMNLTSLQPQEDRLLNVTTATDTTPPSILFTDDSPGYTLTSQPIALNISFSEAVMELAQNDLVLVNCRILSFLRYANQLYLLTVAPIHHGTLSITIPAGIVKDLHNNGNIVASWSKYYPEGILSVSIQEKGALYADLRLQYRYEASASCVVLTSPQAPSDCSVLASLPNAVNTTLLNGESSVRVSDLAVNTTFYGYCCAEEPNDIIMANTIQSTQTVIELGWLDCPQTAAGVCSSHGSCVDGLSCVCDAGHYGLQCSDSCPGLSVTDDMGSIVECGGHGQCDPSSLTCTCSESIYAGETCQLVTLTDLKPADGHVFVYASLILRTNASVSQEYAVQEQKNLILTTIASSLSISPAQTAVRSWSVGSPTRATTSTVTATIVVDGEEGHQEQTAAWFKEADNLNRVATRLTENGYPTERINSSHVYSVTSNQEDVYSCYDGELSPGETDVDCGGVCSKKCEFKQQCNQDTDCLTNVCTEGYCAKKWSIGLIVLVVVLVLLVLFGIGVMVFVYRTRQAEKKGQPSEKEIEMKQKATVELEDLEKQDKAEEAELQRMEEQAKQRRNARREEKKRQKAAAAAAGAGAAAAVEPAPSEVATEGMNAPPAVKESDNLPIPISPTVSSDSVDEV